MAIILFLLDTSGSMNQRTCVGPTYLDYAKIAIDSFMKIRCKDHTNWKDRYMLVTCEEFPAAIKVGWRDTPRDLTPTAYFKQELSKLVAVNVTNLGSAFKCALDLLNLYRVQNGLDNYGQGRNPYLMEPAVVIVISDGCSLTTTQSVTDQLTLPMQPCLPGSDLTKEPFRWDQRIFSIVLRFKGNVDNDFSEMALLESHFNAMCEVSGGKSYPITSQKAMYQALESINQKVMSGVVIQLEKLPSDAERGLASDAWHNTRRMILVKPNNNQLAHWPIPESFWPNREVRPVRTAIPVVYFSCENRRINIVEHLPFDKYELEPSPLTQHILELRQPHTCWPTFIKNSSRDKGIRAPFGYLKASVKGTCVNLFVMPFNYPVLFPLLEELTKEHRMNASSAWVNEFKAYVSSIPVYYYGPLRVALRRLGVPGSLLTVIPDPNENTFFGPQLKSLKTQAKTEVQRYLDQVNNQESKADVPRKHVTVRDIAFMITLEKKIRKDEKELVKNPFHTPRSQILSQLSLLRQEIGLSRSLNDTSESIIESRARFNVPTSKMGLYQETFAKKLRPVDINQRSHMFGNPFKLGSSKKQVNMVITDEVDNIGGANMQQKQVTRRKQLPLKPYPAPQAPSSGTPPQPPGTPPQPPVTDNDTNTHVNGSATIPPILPLSPALYPHSPPLNIATPPTPPLNSIQPPPNLPTSPNNASPFNNPLISSSLSRKRPDPPKPLSPNNTKPTLNSALKPLSTPWVFSPHEPDIAASIGSRTEDKSALEPPPKKPKTTAPPKDQNQRPVNPALRESFLAFSDTESFVDKNKIRDNFGPTETNNGDNKKEVKSSAEAKQKKSRLSLNQDIKRDNKRIKDSISKELRKPGKNYDQLFTLLNQVKGGAELKNLFVNEVITDAQKFKKKTLIEQLKAWQKKLNPR